MHILFFSHYFPPEGNAPANRTYENCVRWARAGHHVTVVTCVPNVPNGVVYEGYQNRLWPQREEVDGIEVIRVWTWLAANSGTTPRIVNYISFLASSVLAVLFRRRPDVIVATSPQFFCGWAGVFTSWLKWRPLVLEIRDIWPESILTVGAMRRGLVIRVLEILERWMYRAATAIVAVGTGYRDKILEKVSVQERIRVIPNGVDLNDFPLRATSSDFRARWGLGNRFVCTYVGTLGMAHGLDITIRTAERLKSAGRSDICFLLVGDGAERTQLEQQAQEQDVQAYLRFTGRLPRAEMPDVLASCNVSLVHLRGTELFGTVIPSKIFETMAMQCPIIMGVKGPAREIVMNAHAGVPLEPDNDEELFHLLVRLADEPAWVASFAQHGREYVASHFNRNQLASEFLELLDSVVAGRRTTRACLLPTPQAAVNAERELHSR